jgi:hypothetical protein
MMDNNDHDQKRPDGLDPFDPARLRLSQDFTAIGVKKAIISVAVRKPDRQWFVRVRPGADWRLPTTVIEIKEEREIYLVDPTVAVELTEVIPIPKPPASKAPRHKPGERFLKGPIPWSWLVRAMGLRGSTLRVALVLWYLAGMAKGSAVVRLSLSKVPGISRWAAAKGLGALEEARLVEVERHPGRKPVVTILDVAGQTDAGGVEP